MISQPPAYDLVVIGAGAAGSTAASTAASKGKHVAMIDHDKIGGTCLNYGCDPTKTLLTIANMLYEAQHAEKYGLHMTAETNWDTVQAYVQGVIQQIRGGTSDEAAAELRKQGIDTYHGEASFISPHEVRVLRTSTDGRNAPQEPVTLHGEQIVIATGSKTQIPPIEGIQDAGYITNIEAVSLQSLPKRLAVVGGGPIGVEFGQMFARFGVEVTIIESSDMLLGKEDRELADMLCNLLEQEGIRTITGTKLKKVEKIANGKRLTLEHKDGHSETVETDEVLLAIGRKPSLENLNLDAAGVQVKEKGKGIVTDATLRTNVPHIWAAGDVLGGLQFTHVAYQQGKIVGTNAFNNSGELQKYEGLVIPWVTYTNPSLSHVGKTEEQLRDEKVQYKVGRMKFSEVERAISNGKTEGLVKLLVDPQGQILGGHILGNRADDLIASIVVAMQNGLRAEQIANTVIPYPTLSEGVRWAADRVE